MEDIMSELKNEKIVNGKSGKPRNYTFMGIAALYLIYLGYELCMGFINQKEGSGIGFMLIGIVFIGVGIAVVIYAVKGSRKRHEMMKAAEAAEAVEAAALEECEEEEVVEKAEPSKKMSISERARMVAMTEEEDSEESQIEE